jgi:hypothetical protein
VNVTAKVIVVTKLVEAGWAIRPEGSVIRSPSVVVAVAVAVYGSGSHDGLSDAFCKQGGQSANGWP